jgi:hypothetical protein
MRGQTYRGVRPREKKKKTLFALLREPAGGGNIRSMILGSHSLRMTGEMRIA